MRSLVFLALAVITYGVNGAKPSKLGRYNQTLLPTDCKKPPAVCNCGKKWKTSKRIRKNSWKNLLALSTKSATPGVVTTTSSNKTEICDNALKKMETKLEKLIVNKLETKLEKLLQQNLETKRLERLTTLINKTADPDIVRQLLNGTFDAALKKIETKLEKIRELTHKGNLSGRVT